MVLAYGKLNECCGFYGILDGKKGGRGVLIGELMDCKVK